MIAKKDNIPDIEHFDFDINFLAHHIYKFANLTGRFRDPQGTVWTFVNGFLHSEVLPASMEYNEDGCCCQDWFFNGKRHRVGGPASIDYVGNKFWYQNGELHNEEGPAATYTDNDPPEYYIKGKELTFEDFNSYILNKKLKKLKKNKSIKI